MCDQSGKARLAKQGNGNGNIHLKMTPLVSFLFSSSTHSPGHSEMVVGSKKVRRCTEPGQMFGNPCSTGKTEIVYRHDKSK